MDSLRDGHPEDNIDVAEAKIIMPLAIAQLNSFIPIITRILLHVFRSAPLKY